MAPIERICARAAFVVAALVILYQILPGTVLGAGQNDRGRIKLLVDEALAAGTDESNREERVRQILATGEKGRKKLRRAARREFRGGYRTYLDAMRERSERMTRERESRLDLEDLTRQRERILEISKAKSTTADLIRAECDPIFMDLATSIAVRPETILESHEDLQRRRDELRALLALWARLESDAGESDPETVRERSARLYDEMKRDEMLAVMLGWDLNGRDRTILIRNHSFLRHADRKEFEAVRLLNSIRFTLGLPALALDSRLAQAGRRHSRDMAERGFRGHDSPVVSRKTPLERASYAGTTASGENIAIGPPTAEEAIDAWWHSPSHHRVMLGFHTRVGIGRHEEYWTMMLGRQPIRIVRKPADPRRVFDPPDPTGRTGGGRQGGSGSRGGSKGGGDSVSDPVAGSAKGSRDR
jgi:hypothetical protein